MRTFGFRFQNRKYWDFSFCKHICLEVWFFTRTGRLYEWNFGYFLVWLVEFVLCLLYVGVLWNYLCAWGSQFGFSLRIDNFCVLIFAIFMYINMYVCIWMKVLVFFLIIFLNKNTNIRLILCIQTFLVVGGKEIRASFSNLKEALWFATSLQASVSLGFG